MSLRRASSVPPVLSLIPRRNFAALCSMKKDPDLEAAICRNRQWIINNQIKNMVLRRPGRVCAIEFLQKKYKTLGFQGKALNWIKKYPRCFEVFVQGNETCFRLTKQTHALIEEEEFVKDQQEPVMADRLTKLLMMSTDHRLNVSKFNNLKKSFGFPEDYAVRILPNYPERFRICRRKRNMEIELVSWREDLAISSVEATARERGPEPAYPPTHCARSSERFREVNSTVYVSPYVSPHGIRQEQTEERIVAVIHELLSLTLWKKASITKLGHFSREFGLPVKLGDFLMKHPTIFYVTNRYETHTVVLREGYSGSELIVKDPLVVVKEKIGALIQERRHHEPDRKPQPLNLEKQEKGVALFGEDRRKSRNGNGLLRKQGEIGGKEIEETKKFLRELYSLLR